MNEEMKHVPFYAFESVVARQERTIKRMWILCIIIFLAFVLSNGAWIYYETQFMDITTTNEVTQDISADGGNAINNGDVTIYGED